MKQKHDEMIFTKIGYGEGVDSKSQNIFTYYCSLEEATSLDWSWVTKLLVRPLGSELERIGINKDGCYTNASRTHVLLVGAMEDQIENSLTLCGSALRVLDIESVKLSELHLNSVRNLRSLLLSECSHLTALPGLGLLTQLTTLELQGCSSITSLPGIEHLTQLETLELQDCNSITSLSGMENLTQLSTLILTGCQNITELQGIEYLMKLSSLELSSCSGITALPESIRLLSSLRRLGLNNLHLWNLPDWLPEIAEKFSRDMDFEHGKNKAIIYLKNTTVEDIPDMAIFDQPFLVIEEFFRQRSQSQTQMLNEIKVIFLGDGGAGKSHTIARLMNDGGDPVDYTDQTAPGIVIKHKDYTVDGRTFRVNYWDFGGQEIIHSMHRIFLTGRTMYVILLNARDDTQSDRAKYWLHNIKSFAPNAPVLLVLNKIDQNERASIDERGLRSRFSMLTQVVKLSAKDFSQEEFNNRFTRVLLEEIQNTGFLDTQLPASWIKIKSRLENMASHYIFGDDYKKICEECGVHDNQKDLLHWFNDLGVSFCYGGDEIDYALEDYVILRPDWITNALYIILFNSLEEARNGLIPHKSIYNLLRNTHNNPAISCTLPQARYNTSDIQYILGIMRKFNLSFTDGQDNEFIPMLCQQNSMVDLQYYQKDTDILEFNMEFDYLPNNLLHRLMVERYSELDMNTVWRTGARFAIPELGYSAVVVIDSNTLCFFVRQTDSMHRADTYLSMLKANVDRIVQKMGLSEPDGIIIYKLDGNRDSFQYEMLTAMVEAGQSAVYSRVFRRMIPIADILGEDNASTQDDEKTLLSSVAKSCLAMQGEPHYRTAPEDMKSRRIRDDLEFRGYVVRDQSQWGSSRMGMRMGEIDLIICKENKQPWAAFNMLSVRGKEDLHKWNDHLAKTLTSHHSRELPMQFLISFVECDQSDYHRLWAIFNKHMRKYEPRNGKRMGEYQHVLPLPELSEYLRVARMDYDIGGTAVTVYHYFVCMGEPSLQDLSLPDVQQKRLESAIAEIVALKQHLEQEQKQREMAEAAVQDAQNELEIATARRKEQVAELQDTLSRMQEESNSTQLRLAELEEMDAKAEMFAAEIDVLRSKYSQLSFEHSQLQEDARHNQMLLKEANASAQKALAERDDLASRYKKQEKEITKLQSEIGILLREHRTDAESDRKAAEIEKLLAQLTEKQQALKDTEAAAMEAVEKHKRLDFLVTELKQREIELQAARANAKDAVNSQRELELLYADSKRRQIEAQEAVLQAQKENGLLAEQAVESTKQIQELEKQLRTMTAQNPAPEEEELDETSEEDTVQAKKEYRVIILGDSEAGKSQILYRLRHPNRKPERFSGDVTPGIDIASRCYDIGDDTVRVNFWDFGGQEILHSLHRLFLAKNTMYVIVLNTRNDNQDEQAKFWLHYVELYATGAPVILVLNKIDQNPTASLNMPVLERLFQDTAVIMDVLSLSARNWSSERFNQEFVDKLKMHIATVMDDTNAFTDEELSIRDQIRTQGKDLQIVEMSTFKRICTKGNLPKGTDINKLAERFHKAGMLVYFGTRTNMIMNPDWITDAIYKILERGSALAVNGIIDYETIEDILYDDEVEQYQKSQIDFIMKIMRKYGLSFQYQAPTNDLPEQEFIPVLCRREEPTSVQYFISKLDVIQMQVIFRYLPAGVLYQLMVDLKAEMCKDNVWLSGATFENSSGCSAVVTREKDRMIIYVQGENRVLALRYMESIRERVAGIAKGDMYNADVQETLLGYYIADRGEVEFFDYDRLSLSKELNLSYAMSKRKPGTLSVRDILDQRDGAYIQERDQLLQLVLRGCIAIQKDKIFRDVDENSRNRELARMIQAALTPKDQTEGGDSGTGKGLGELDIEILNEHRTPIAILEALNTESINTANWREHLNKLVDNYNTSGLRYLILTSYVQCPKEKFKTKFGETAEHWKNAKPKGYEKYLDGVDTYVMDECPELIRITRADYVRNDFKVSLYHFLVHIVGNEDDTSSQSAT